MNVEGTSGISPEARVLGVIPARLGSTRLPRKVLRQIAGRPLLAWVYDAAAACPQLGRLIVAVDSDEVAAVCEANGWPWRMTSSALPSGTDRLCAIAQEIEADIYVNVQGDEPLLESAHIDALLAPFGQPDVGAVTLKVRCTVEEILDPNAVKVVTAHDGRALYFSRASIPFDRDRTGQAPYWKHLGLYAYTRATLERFDDLPPSALEQVERLEQLRLLENGLPLYVSEVAHGTLGVDTEQDLQRVEAILLARSEAAAPKR